MESRIVQSPGPTRRFLLAGIGAPIAIGLLKAPPASAEAISYVASVKLNNAVDARTLSEYSPGGRFSATAITLGNLLRIAWRVQSYQVVGAPAWLTTRRYDIVAKVDDVPPPSQLLLLRALLADRFKLAVHNETREMSRLALVLARSDGRLGPQLTKSSFDCAAYMAGPHPPPEPGRTPPCATRIGPTAMSGKAISMAQLANSLSPFVNRYTVDKTGLAGGFDVELTWTPDPAPPDIDTPPPSDTGPSIFTAIQEQLGLKLVSEKGPVDVLVVDRVEEPSEN
jgi:uncharacterized protein (TIGR03435 family)